MNRTKFGLEFFSNFKITFDVIELCKKIFRGINLCQDEKPLFLYLYFYCSNSKGEIKGI